MLKNLKIAIYLLLIFQVKSAIGQTSYIITPDQLYINAASYAYQSVKPGDTLYFQGGNKQYLLIKGFKGAPGKPIVMINSGGPIIIDTDFYYGINIQNCQYIKFTGTGLPNTTYGFQVKRVAAGAGLSVGGLSSDFEIDHVSIENTMIAGLYAKTDPDCDLTAVRSNFTQYNTIIHDNYIGHAGDEGMYIGSTKYTGQNVLCNGKDTLLMPSLLDGVQVYNNIVEYSGWDGIQVSSAYRNCQIYNNTVTFDSQSGEYAQMSGIILGGGTKADCYNNFISQGKGDGIECHGLGGCRIFNNIIVDPGRSFMPTDLTQMKHGMYISDVTVEDGGSFYIQNNTIINPKSDGIRFSSSKSKNNLIASNIIINPGSYDMYQNGNTRFKGIDSYIMLQDIASDVTRQNNYLSRIADSVKFVSATFQSPEDLKLQAVSPLIDQAETDPAIDFDFEGSPRPVGVKSDIGAFEFQSETTISNPLIQTVTGGGSYCDNGTGVAIGLSSSQKGVKYQLYLNSAILATQMDGTGSAINFGLQTADGEYTVIGTDTLTTASSTMAGSASIISNPLPTTYTVTGGSINCSGGTGVLVGLNGSQTGVYYQLLLDGINSGVAIPGTGTAITFGLKSTVGNYTVIASYPLNTCTVTMTGSATITSSTAPLAPAAIGGTKSVCAGNTTTLTDATAGGVWSSLNTAIATISTNGVVTGLSAGTVTINYTVTNEGGCSNLATTTVTVNAMPSALSPISGNKTVCKGNTTLLTETTTGGIWSTSNSSIAKVSTTGLVSGVAAGTVTIRYTLTNGSGCSNVASTSITVNPLPGTPSKFTTSTSRVSKGTSNVVYTVPNVTGMTYIWSFTGTGATISGTGNSVKISFSLTATSGTLSVSATNGCGTSSPRTMSISLVKGAVIPEVTIDTTTISTEIVTPANFEAVVGSPSDSSFMVSVLAPAETMISEAKMDFNVYPNPTVDSATFDFQIDNSTHVTLDIFSIKGQCIARIFDGELETGIPQKVYFQKSLPSGYYSCVLRWGGKMLTKKLIVMQ